MFKYTQTPAFTDNTSQGLIANRIKKNEKILEFGCAQGEMAKFLTENLNCSVWGIEISEEAIAQAKPYLKKAICADIEEYQWEKEIENERFNVVIFADTLEHLKNPEKALIAATKYLEPDGRIVFSIPNIAHADIISKLLYDRFDYTSYGILDNTHLHFWGRNNLSELCANASLFLKEISATYAAPGSTEQFFSHDNTVNTFINQHGRHDIYQFVCTAYNKDYAEKNSLNFVLNIPQNTPFTTKVYFDRGAGFTTNESIVITHDNPNSIDFCVDNLEDVDKLRVDLCDFAGYISQNESFEIDSSPAFPDSSINSIEMDDVHILFQNDPQYIFNLQKKASVFHMKADMISAFDFQKLEKFISDINSEKNITLSELSSQKEKNAALTDELSRYKIHYETAIAQREDLKRQLDCVKMQYATVTNATFWKITKPLRIFCDLLKRIPPFKIAFKFFSNLKNYGLKYTIKKIRRKLKVKKAASAPIITEKALKRQREKKFERDIKISILVPLYNTPTKFLKEMISSVIAQTYSNWELCLADGSDEKHLYVQKICEDYSNKNSRIKYRKLEKNLGISENTNACIDIATGDYLALFDHDDILHPSALHEVMNAICLHDADFIYTDENTFYNNPSNAFCPHFKPDYSPDTLRSYNYICHFSVFSRNLLNQVGRFSAEYDGSQDYDIILRLTEKAKKIVHIPQILYYWRSHKNSVASDISAKPYTIQSAKKAIFDHMKRLGLNGTVKDSMIPSTYKIEYEITDTPLISIIIPNKDHTPELCLCIDSIQQKSTYKNFEIIIVENNSTEPETFECYNMLSGKYKNVKVVRWEHEFNYSKLNNFGFKYTSGEYIVLLNNDIEIITNNWLEEMLMFVQRKDVGVAGMMLYYPDNTIQHAGVILGIGGVAGHSHKYFKRGDYGYSSRLTIAQNLSAVTAAAMMIRRDVFEEVSGLDETFAVAFNDVDLCLRIRKAGYNIVWTPYAEAYHYESKSRGPEDTPEKQQRFKGECDKFHARWDYVLDSGDPYYNPNLTLEKEDFSTR